MSPQLEEEKKQWSITGVAIPAGVLLGLGIGFFLDNIIPGILIGLGIWFFFMMIGMLILQIKK